jgi:hypothetical protein
MILNVFSITEIFVSVISLVLMAWAGTFSFVLASRWAKASEIEQRSQIEGRSHLVLLVAVIILGIRLFNWPLFYATLQSFIQDIDGAMCIFGVTQVRRVVTGVSELMKPVSFFLIGTWLLMHLLDQRSRTSSLMGRKLLLLAFTALFVVAESLIDIFLMLKIAPGTLVSCCTTVTDILERPTRLVPKSVLGPGYGVTLGSAFYISHILLIAVLCACMFLIKTSSPPRWRRPLLSGAFLLAVLNAGLFVLAQIEVHAPKIMGLPFHHCLYCLWQYVPDTILMYLLFVLGTSATGWAFFLDLFGRTGETMDALSMYLKTICGVSLFCLAAAMIMNTIHLIAA